MARCEEYFFGICPGLHPPFLDARQKHSVHVRKLQRPLNENPRGTILILSDNINVVLPLRIRLLREEYSLAWSGNFWQAISKIHHERFSGLIIDLKTPSLEEAFLLDFMDEYYSHSHGQCVVFHTCRGTEGLQRLMQERGCILFDRKASVDTLTQHLSLK